MEPSRATGQKEKVTTVFVLAQRAKRPSKTRGSRECFFKAPIGTINDIFAAPRRIGSHPSRVMSVARLSAEDPNSEPKRARVKIRPALSFSDEEKMGTI